MKLCINCKYYVSVPVWVDGDFCCRPEVISPVDGKFHRSAHHERRNDPDRNTCGPSGRFWEQRVEIPKVKKDNLLQRIFKLFRASNHSSESKQ